MSLSQIPFWYLRHGQTDWNAQNLSQGNIDIPLNARGIEQAHAAAEKLKGRGIVSIIASPLSRAADTARIVADALGLDVALEEGLREVSFGVQEGKPMVGWFDDWVAGHFTPEMAESFHALRHRGREAVNRALQAPAPVLIVAHGALFRALRAEMGLDPNFRTPNAAPIFCRPGQPEWDLLPVT